MERLRTEHTLSMTITREDSVRILMSQAEPDQGEYLFRTSSHSPGGVVLSMYYNGNVRHFQIERRAYDGKFVTDSGLQFANLEVRLKFHYFILTLTGPP